MSSLIEKALLTGFGIVTLIIFLSFLSPFFKEVNDFNTNERDEIDRYLLFMEEIDHRIKSVIENRSSYYPPTIEYPKNLNVTFSSNYAIFTILLKDGIHKNILGYDGNFSYAFYSDIPTEVCLIDVYFQSDLIVVLISPYK